MDVLLGKHVESIIILLLIARSVTFCPLLSVRKCRLCFPITPLYISSRPVFDFKFLSTILILLFDVSSWFNHLNNIWRRMQIMKLWTTQFSPFFCYFFLESPNTLRSTPSQTSFVRILPALWETLSSTHILNRQNCAVFYLAITEYWVEYSVASLF